MQSDNLSDMKTSDAVARAKVETAYSIVQHARYYCVDYRTNRVGQFNVPQIQAEFVLQMGLHRPFALKFDDGRLLAAF